MPRSPWLVLGFPAMVAGAISLTGCPCQCINECGRSYELRASDGVGGARFDNVSEGGNECDLPSKPHSIPDVTQVFVARVEAVQPAGPAAHSYQLFLEQHLAPTLAPAACAGRRSFASVDELTAVALPPGTELCVVGVVRTLELCTQKGCGV